MKNITLLFFFLITIFGYSQVIDILPKDEYGKVHFSKIISSNELSQEETYNKSKVFFINNFNSGKDVIQLEDKNNSVIIGKGNTPIEIQSGKYKFSGLMSFSIKIESKDNKCKVDIYNIVYNNDSPAEIFFNQETEKNYKKANGKAKTIMENYRDQTLEKVAFLESKLTEEFNKKNEDW